MGFINRIFFILIILFTNIPLLHAQQQEKRMTTYTNYLLYVPKEKPTNGLYPLLLFLHGSGERGNDLSLLKKNGPPSFLDQPGDFPFIVVSPQCPENQNWDTQTLLALLDHIEKSLPVDKNRVYVTGLSMGGFGVWNLAQAAPDRFAAIAPVCGGGNLDRLCIMRHVPVWAFHGAKDMVVPPNESERLVERLREFGSDVKFTLYPDAEHDSWTSTYQNQELYKWLLSKSKDLNVPVEAVSENVLKSYVGKYKYSDSEIMEVSYDGRNLVVQSSVAKRKLQLKPFSETRFRLPGPISGDGDMYFDVTSNGKVLGFTVGPCDHTYCPKVE